jgi:hypothetical protein
VDYFGVLADLLHLWMLDEVASHLKLMQLQKDFTHSIISIISMGFLIVSSLTFRDASSRFSRVPESKRS